MERVNFTNSRDLNLVGKFWEADSDKGVVMAHGFTGNKDEWGRFTEVAEDLNSAGFNVLSFDFSGCGESDDDSITIEKEADDLNSAIDFLKSNGVNNLGVLGLSQGGWTTLETYKQRKDISCLVLVAPITDSLPDYREQKLSPEQRKELREQGKTVKTREKGKRNRFVIPENLIDGKENVDQDELLKGIDCPVLFIHGTEDETVPLEHSRKAVEKIENADLKTIKDDHYWGESVEEVAETSIEFFKQNV